jgi:hypothetical protein
MDTPDVRFSRISKLLVDRDEAAPDDVLAQRRGYTVTLACGDDVAASYTLQVAVLTTANIAARCFPGAVRVALPSRLAEAPLRLWPALPQSFGEALASLLGPGTLADGGDQAGGRSVVFGNAVKAPPSALRVTFDGWIAKVGPVQSTERLQEREYCPLAGTLGAAMAVSELFLAFAEIHLEAARRTIALSLWRPDLDATDPLATGIPVEFLPRDFWTLGLGHLGNGYLWSLATLPYRNASEAIIYLNDFDEIEPENVETSLLFAANDADRYKTRTCSAWLERRGFRTRLVERPFDGDFRCRKDEPQLAFSGFDTNPARRYLATARFDRVIDSGLGGTPNNFDTISAHTFPNPRPAEEIWPDLSPKEDAKRIARQERMAKENAGYARTGEDECGRYRLAGKSIAVPFVGAAAAALVVAEALRIFHGGTAYTDIKLSLADAETRAARASGTYRTQDLAGLRYCAAR